MHFQFRPLTTRELEILGKLLEPEFPGRDELRQQVGSLTARELFEDGTLALKCGANVRAPVTCRVPTEGEYIDADGYHVNVLLHVVDGLMTEMEVLKLFPSKILNPPEAKNLFVTVHHRQR